MSKFWLLLLFVAAFQFAHSYPAEHEVDEYTSDEADEYMSDQSDLSDEETRSNVIKETWNQLKDKYKEISAMSVKKILAVFKDRYCDQQEDFAEDYQSDEAQDLVSVQYNRVLTLKKLYEQANEIWGQNKGKLKEALVTLRQKFCVKLNELQQRSDFNEDEGDDGGNGDEERLKFRKKIGRLVKGVKKGLKKVGFGAKEAMKKGLSFLKKMGVTISPLQC
uniref:Putative secreted protein n=1 Tax=Panstrongylus lignarius TaxID=156445 RepID=A0A224XJR2_9HEMI